MKLTLTLKEIVTPSNTESCDYSEPTDYLEVGFSHSFIDEDDEDDDDGDDGGGGDDD